MPAGAFGYFAGVSVRRPELREEASHASLHLVPGHERLIAHAVVQRQIASHLPTVLNVCALKLAAGIEELARRLSECIEIPKQEVGDGIAAGVVAIEGKLARLLEEIVYVNLRYLAVIAEVDIVPTEQPMHIVGQGVVGAVEERLRIATDGEEAAYWI